MKVRNFKLVKISLSDLREFQGDLKRHDQASLDKFKASILTDGFSFPFHAWEEGEKIHIIDGHLRKTALLDLEKDGHTLPETFPVLLVEAQSEKEAKKLILMASTQYHQIDKDQLVEFIRINDIELDFLERMDLPEIEMNEIISIAEYGDWETHARAEGKGSLSEKFLAPPFSVLDASQGYWLERKRQWLEIFDSSSGREEGLAFSTSLSRIVKSSNGTSVFDPVLCEILYYWFNTKGGHILDPFAGGVVRGAVAGIGGYGYTGFDLSSKQIETNQADWNSFKHKFDIAQEPTWINDNSLNIPEHLAGQEFDLIFSCPPYFDLEVYTDHPEDLSNQSFEQFKEDYKQIIHGAVSLLKDNRFCVFVIGDVRDKKTGFYRKLIPLTISAFEEAGAYFYNDIILKNPYGSASVRAGKFTSSRKVVKVHQNVLVFFKGDPKKIKDIYGEIEIKELEENYSESSEISLDI